VYYKNKKEAVSINNQLHFLFKGELVGSCMNTQKTNSKTLEYFVADPNLERLRRKEAPKSLRDH
jgi:hypothetical protein